MSTLGTHTDAAVAFLEAAAAGDARAAFNRHTAPGFRHHNPYFASDAESLLAALDENAKRHPSKVLEVQRTLEDGDFVAVHSCVRVDGGQRPVALVHIFRFEGERIAELWDLSQEEPADSPNELGMF